MGELFNGCLPNVSKDGKVYHLNNGIVKSDRRLKEKIHNDKKKFNNYPLYLNNRKIAVKLNNIKNNGYTPPLPFIVHYFDQKQFLLLHCQFLVLDNTTIISSDTSIEWDYIQEVIILCQEYPICPICLYHPLPAKMTKCGHIYCWPCVLHYLSLSENYWRRCPICNESVKKEDLKSVQIKKTKTYQTGEEITFVLLKCQKGTVNVQKAYSDPDEDDESCDMQSFQKTILINREYLINNVLLKERSILEEMAQNEEKEFDSTNEVAFIIEALELLQERLNEIALIHDNTCYSDPESLSIPIPKKPNTLLEPAFNYFYQAIDGLPLYLHPLNTKMIMDSAVTSTDYLAPSIDIDPESSPKFGHATKALVKPPDWSKFPNKLENLVIVSLDTNTVTTEFRKRYRFLSHLPLHKELSFVEVSFFKNETLCSGIYNSPNSHKLHSLCDNDLWYIPASVFVSFFPTLLSRFNERDRRLKQEQRSSKRTNAATSDSSGLRKVNSNNEEDFVAFNRGISQIDINNEVEFPSAPTHGTIIVSEDNNATTSSSWKGEASPSDKNQHLSFAQLVKEVTKNDIGASVLEWTDVSKLKYKFDQQPSRSGPNNSTLASVTPSEDESDPELKPYLWNSTKDRPDSHSLNLLDILIKPSDEKRKKKR